MANPDLQQNFQIPSHLSQDQSSELIDKMELLSREEFLQFFHAHVDEYDPNWIVRNPSNFLAKRRIKLNDGLPYVKDACIFNSTYNSYSRLRDAHYLWTQEFLSPDNFEVFIKLIQTDFSREEFLNQMNEADYNFMTHWATLVIRFSKAYPDILPADLVYASSSLLGFIQAANDAREGEQFAYGSEPNWTYKYRQLLPLYEVGSNPTDMFKSLSEEPAGPAYTQSVDTALRHLPFDLGTHREAGLHYGSTTSTSRLDTRRAQNVPAEDNEDIARTVAFAQAMRKRDEQSNAYFRTEVGQRQSFASEFKRLTVLIETMTNQADPILSFTIKNAQQLDLAQIILQNKNGLFIGFEYQTQLSTIQNTVEVLLKKVSIETWDLNRPQLITLLEIMRTLRAEMLKIDEDYYDYEKERQKYRGEKVSLYEREETEILNLLKAFVENDIVKSDRINQSIIDRLLGKRKKSQVTLLPNYPVLGAVTLSTVLLLAGYLESQGPLFSWGNKLREVTERVIEDFGTYAQAILYSWAGAGEAGERSSNSNLGYRQLQVNAYLEANHTYVPQNTNLEAIKQQHDQTPRFTVETPQGARRVLPNRSQNYTFDPDNPFRVNWSTSDLRAISFSTPLIEPLNHSTGPAPDVRLTVDMRNISTQGLLLPVNQDINNKLTLHLYSYNPDFFSIESPDNVTQYQPTFVADENGAAFLFFPPLHISPDTVDVPEIIVDIFLENDQAAQNFFPNYAFGITFTPYGYGNPSTRQLLRPITEYLEASPTTENSTEAADVSQPLAAEELTAFLIEQGFDLNKLYKILYNINTPEAEPYHIVTETMSKVYYDDNRILIYREILRQMRELGFTYSVDTQVNQYLNAEDVRGYFIVGKHIGLDCDGLSFVANLIANAVPPNGIGVNREIVLVEADINRDGAFSGQINHAQIVIASRTELYSTMEVTSDFDVNTEASPEQIQAVIDEMNQLIGKLDQQSANFELLVKFFASSVVALSGVLVARSMKKKAARKLKKIGSTKDISKRIKAKAHQLETRVVEKVFPAFEQLTPAQLAKVSEVLSIILTPSLMDRMDRDQLQLKTYDIDSIKQLLLAFEYNDRIAPSQQIDAATTLTYLGKRIFEVRENSSYRKALIASLDSVIDTHSSQEGMEPVFLAIQALLR
ncbi:MAG: hypothetical protein M3Q81_04250 [bacterium]|nr:hypothetical protein [bacterium]